MLEHVSAGGWLLIADEAKNLKEFEPAIAAHSATWRIERPRRGCLFAHRQ